MKTDLIQILERALVGKTIVIDGNEVVIAAICDTESITIQFEGYERPYWIDLDSEFEILDEPALRSSDESGDSQDDQVAPVAP